MPQNPTDFAPEYLSASPEIQWPAVPGREGIQLCTLMFQLEQSQWWTPAQLRRAQKRQLLPLLAHARQHTEYYRKIFGKRSPAKLLEAWDQIPLLSRSTIQSERESLVARRVPQALGPVHNVQTSGSTGTPIKVMQNGSDILFWQALTLRETLWHRRNLEGRLASIRPDRKLPDKRWVDSQNWGPPMSHVFKTGPSSVMDSRVDTEAQLKWLLQRKPSSLLSMPSNLHALAELSAQQQVGLPGLECVIAYGEVLEPETRRLIEEAWGVPVQNIYSAQEVGYIALQCPENPDHLHVQSENLLVEVLDDQGQACKEGEVGRVVLTALHAYAMPLIRYANQDFAEVGGQCSCGRGLPVIKRVLGRQRNMAVTPDGRRYWPSFPSRHWMHIEKIRQIQFVQNTPSEIDVRLLSDEPLTPAEEQELNGILTEALGYAYQFSFTVVDSIPRGKNDKYEDFVCHV